MFNSFEDPSDVPAREAYMEERFDVPSDCGDHASCHTEPPTCGHGAPVKGDPYDEGYYYSGTGEWSEDDSYIDYLNR